ncbi:MAG: hypothetical protein MJ252_23475, partial [archaeon]|nr:hypothetical protein [archaeon]
MESHPKNPSVERSILEQKVIVLNLNLITKEDVLFILYLDQHPSLLIKEDEENKEKKEKNKKYF